MTPSFSNAQELWAFLWVEELVRLGVRHFVISPGSRSTPLTIAVARHPKARPLVWIDERGAAFAALGIGRETGVPAVLICSSGTAGANYLPAVVEAASDKIPLLVCTADRPPELQETGANQTIRQHDLYGDFLRWKRSMPCADDTIDQAFVLTTAAQAFHSSLSEPAGPVHLNWPFREPLVPVPDARPLTLDSSLLSWWTSGVPWTLPRRPAYRTQSAPLEELAERCASVSRGLLVVGRMPAGRSVGPLLQLAEALQWPLLVDVGSGLRFGHATPLRIRGWDSVLRSVPWQEAMAPDMILHLGEGLVGKRWLEYARRHRGCEHIHVHTGDERVDPVHSLTSRWQTCPLEFARELRVLLPNKSPSPWLRQWQRAGESFHDLRSRHLEGQGEVKPPLEPALLRALSGIWEEGERVFVGNSMPIRDLDLWGREEAPAISLYTNRGASGIDGLLATSIGVTLASGGRGIAVLGDLSLLHDLNSLVLLQQSGVRLTVIVLNNSGGGIFHHLPVRGRDDVFAPFFETPHAVQLAAVASSLQLKTFSPETLSEFESVIKEAISAEGPVVVEVQTSSENNLAWWRRFHEDLKASVATLLPDSQQPEEDP